MPYAAERESDLRAQLVERRAVPTVFIMDTLSGSVIASTGYALVWEEIQLAAEQLIQEHREQLDDGSSASSFVGDRYVLRARKLDADGQYAVMAEQFRSRNPMRDATTKYVLTPRESEVAHLVVLGAGTADIAEALSIAPSTVVLHVKRIMAKTGAKTRSAMVSRIVRHSADGHDHKEREQNVSACSV